MNIGDAFEELKNDLFYEAPDRFDPNGENYTVLTKADKIIKDNYTKLSESFKGLFPTDLCQGCLPRYISDYDTEAFISVKPNVLCSIDEPYEEFLVPTIEVVASMEISYKKANRYFNDSEKDFTNLITQSLEKLRENLDKQHNHNCISFLEKYCASHHIDSPDNIDKNNLNFKRPINKVTILKDNGFYKKYLAINEQPLLPKPASSRGAKNMSTIGWAVSHERQQPTFLICDKDPDSLTIVGYADVGYCLADQKAAIWLNWA